MSLSRKGIADIIAKEYFDKRLLGKYKVDSKIQKILDIVNKKPEPTLLPAESKDFISDDKSEIKLRLLANSSVNSYQAIENEQKLEDQLTRDEAQTIRGIWWGMNLKARTSFEGKVIEKIMDYLPRLECSITPMYIPTVEQMKNQLPHVDWRAVRASAASAHAFFSQPSALPPIQPFTRGEPEAQAKKPVSVTVAAHQFRGGR